MITLLTCKVERLVDVGDVGHAAHAVRALRVHLDHSMGAQGRGTGVGVWLGRKGGRPAAVWRCLCVQQHSSRLLGGGHRAAVRLSVLLLTRPPWAAVAWPTTLQLRSSSSHQVHFGGDG